MLPPLNENNQLLLNALDREMDEEIDHNIYLLALKQLPSLGIEALQKGEEPSERYAVEFGLWRELYYRRKMQIDVSSRDGNPLGPLIRSYVAGLAWIFKYYFRGCPSWVCR